jgi:ATP-binding cassette subfamily B protein
MMGRMKGDGKKAKNPIQTFKRLMSYMFERYKFRFLLVCVLIILSALASIAGSAFIAPFTDNLMKIVSNGETGPNGTFFGLLAAMIAIYVFGIICNFTYSRLMMYIAQGTMKRLRDDMFSHMQTLPLKFFDGHTHGELMSCYTNDTDTLRMLLSQTIPQFISSIITIVGVFCAMLFYSVTLTVAALVFIVLLLFTVVKITGKSSVYFIKQQISLSKVNGYIEEMMEGQKVVKVFNHEQKAIEGFESLNEDLRKNATSANAFINVMGPFTNNLGYFEYVIIALLGVALAYGGGAWGLSLYGVMNETHGALTLASILAYLSFVRQFNMPVQQIAQQFNNVVMGMAGAERIFEILDAKSEDKGGNITLVRVKKTAHGYEEQTDGDLWAWKKPASCEEEKPQYGLLRGDIRFDDVVFGYNEEKVILNHITLYARPGQKIAFVGSTGAGKTTITNLINRFYDIQSGHITYDGLDIRSIDKDDLRRSLGVVLQDTHLFTGTVMDNIRYGRLNATDEECVAAARLANADFFIRHLPEGYQTVLHGDGSNLSQGQRQLLAIARAMVSDCPVLILDEATSSIDTRTEKLIEEGMDKLMEGRTVFVIAHRLSTVRNSHAIMVLERGEIIERGTHAQLLEQKGKYYQLYTGAFELD